MSPDTSAACEGPRCSNLLHRLSWNHPAQLLQKKQNRIAAENLQAGSTRLSLNTEKRNFTQQACMWA
jgi:hypothetical protein